MNILSFFSTINNLLAIPTSCILLGIALFFTWQLKFLQFRSFKKFFRLLRSSHHHQKKIDAPKTISPLYALFTAMSTSLGIGTIVGPSIAIILGGPGALFWLVFYVIIASITKYVEVVYAIKFREILPDGTILGGPMQYLNKISSYLGMWYALATVILFTGWSGVQANSAAEILAQVAIPEWITGLAVSCIVFLMLNGGAERIGAFSSTLVPIMTALYIASSSIILFKQSNCIIPALQNIIHYAFTSHAALGGFIGSTVYLAIRSGIYKGAYITESGIGTSSIPHALADAQPTDQATLAMVSVYVDAFICFISGLLILFTDFWCLSTISNTVIYNVFQYGLPFFGKPIITFTILLFALGTVIGNSFNARQSFATLTHNKFLQHYNVFVCSIIFVSSIASVPLIWEIIEILLPLVAIPNALGILWLSFKYKQFLF